MVQLSHKTILLVEDEFLIAMAEKAILEDYGYSVLLAHTGEDAVQIMEKENSIDLILMDINLGKGIDGTEAAKQILKNHDLPLIFLSSHTEREIVDKTEGITSYGYIVKDSGETVLIQSIKMAFRLFNAQMSRQEKEDLKLKSMVLDQIKDFVTITDTKGIVTYVNKIQEKELGLSKEDIIGKSICFFGKNPELGATQREILSETLNKGSWRGEVVNRTADGRDIILNCRTQVIYDEKGNPISLCGISTDITEQKEYEEKLRRSERLQRLILSAIPDMLMRFDREGRYLDILNYREDELAMPRDEVIGKKVSDIIPGDLGTRLEKAILTVLKTNKVESVEYDLDVPAGHSSFEARIVPFSENEVIALIRNVTQWKKTEKKIEALLHEKELLLKESHHRIKNNMGIIKSLLNLQAQKTDRMDSRFILKDAVSRVQSMMVLYEKLYHSESYSELNVKDFLPSLIHDIVALFQGEKPVRTDLHIDRIVMDSRTLSTLGIILNECITNSMKYAFDTVEDPLITLRVNKVKNKIVVSYSDNGSGFLDKELPDKRQNFGFQLIDMLVQQLNGTLKIDSTQGMKIVIEF
ncbi:MAG: PAS domain S-box protein [Fidelibacterota bacterium]